LIGNSLAGTFTTFSDRTRSDSDPLISDRSIRASSKDTRENFKHLRKTKHTHHPVDDAMGNAEALLRMRDEMGLKIEL
jgi:hypothetical protein